MAKPLPGAGRLMLAALRNGGTFETCEIFVGLALIRTGLATEEPFQGSPFGALKLTQAGKLVVMPPPAVPERTPDHPQLQLPLDPPKAPKKATKVATGPAVAKSPSARPAAATPAAKRRRA